MGTFYENLKIKRRYSLVPSLRSKNEKVSIVQEN